MPKLPLIRRLPRSLRRRWRRGIERLADLIPGFATTVPEDKILPNPCDRNQRYEPLDYRALKIISKRVPMTSEDVMYDLGCGMGRMVCFFARRSIKLCVGIELSAELAESARRNASRLMGRRAPVDIYTIDATQADLTNATVIGMFNPFGEEVLRTVMENLDRSIQSNPRRVRVFYANPHHFKVLSEFPTFHLADQFSVPCRFIKFDVMIWENARTTVKNFPVPTVM